MNRKERLFKRRERKKVIIICVCGNFAVTVLQRQIADTVEDR